MVGGDHGGGDDGGGVVPSEGAGGLGEGEVGGEVIHPSAAGVVVVEDAHVDVAVGADHGGGGAVVGEDGAASGLGIDEGGGGGGDEGGGVECDEAAGAVVAGAHGDVEGGAVGGECGCGVGDDLGEGHGGGVDLAGFEESANAGGRDAGDAVGDAAGGGVCRLVSEVDVALVVGGDGGADGDAGVVGGLVRLIGSERGVEGFLRRRDGGGGVESASFVDGSAGRRGSRGCWRWRGWGCSWGSRSSWRPGLPGGECSRWGGCIGGSRWRR